MHHQTGSLQQKHISQTALIECAIFKTMFIKHNNDTYIIRLIRGEELINCLEVFAKAHKVAGGFFHGLGGAESAILGLYTLDDKQYMWKDFAGPLELVSINGNIALDHDGNVIVHCHSTISGPDMVASGGHVKRAIIAGTCELFLDLRTGPLERSHNEEIGLKLLTFNDDA